MRIRSSSCRPRELPLGGPGCAAVHPGRADRGGQPRCPARPVRLLRLHAAAVLEQPPGDHRHRPGGPDLLSPTVHGAWDASPSQAPWLWRGTGHVECTRAAGGGSRGRRRAGDGRRQACRQGARAAIAAAADNRPSAPPGGPPTRPVVSVRCDPGPRWPQGIPRQETAGHGRMAASEQPRRGYAAAVGRPRPLHRNLPGRRADFDSALAALEVGWPRCSRRRRPSVTRPWRRHWPPTRWPRASGDPAHPGQHRGWPVRRVPQSRSRKGRQPDGSRRSHVACAGTVDKWVRTRPTSRGMRSGLRAPRAAVFAELGVSPDEVVEQPGNLLVTAGLYPADVPAQRRAGVGGHQHRDPSGHGQRRQGRQRWATPTSVPQRARRTGGSRSWTPPTRAWPPTS